MIQLLPYLDLILPYFFPSIVISGAAAVLFLIITLTIRCSVSPKKLNQIIRDTAPEPKTKKQKNSIKTANSIKAEDAENNMGQTGIGYRSNYERDCEITENAEGKAHENDESLIETRAKKEKTQKKDKHSPPNTDSAAESTDAHAPVTDLTETPFMPDSTDQLDDQAAADPLEVDLDLKVMDISYGDDATPEPDELPFADSNEIQTSPGVPGDILLESKEPAPEVSVSSPAEPASTAKITAPTRKKVLQGTISPRVRRQLEALFDIPLASELEGWDTN